MTYSAGNVIVATDYNGFAAGNANNINAIWGTGTGNSGYGQSTTLSNVSPAATITATQWSSLNSRITSMGGHTGTTLTSRTNPVAGNVISILANLQTDINSITLNRSNSVALGTQYTAWTGNASQTANIVTANAFTLTFTNRVAFANANAARYFFNGGGLVKNQTSKTSTGTEADDEWNALATTVCGALFISQGGTTQSLAGNAYTGTTKVGGSGTPTTLTTGTGFNQFTTTPTSIYKQYSTVYGYTQNYIEVRANVNSNTTPSDLTLVTIWNGEDGNTYHPVANITGGTATTGITFGTAPAAVVTYFPPSSTYLTEASWGTPTVTATVANTTTTSYTMTYLVAGGGGAGGGAINSYGAGGGGAGGYLTGSLTAVGGYAYTMTVGGGGGGSFANPGNVGGTSTISQSTLSPIGLVISYGGGGGAGGTLVNGLNGGSGGGGGSGSQSAGGLGGLGVSGQGNNGGARQVWEGNLGGGGGGSAGAGGTSGAGGGASSSSITGSSVARAGGGGGSQAGAGGGGGATNGANGNASPATSNTGSGGGGGAHAAASGDPFLTSIGFGGNGGSGVIIISVPTANYTGTTTGSPSVTTSGANTIMQFNSTGSYTA
jgi:hypothetical protein